MTCNGICIIFRGDGFYSIYMHGSVSWVWQKKDESRINAEENRALRIMPGVTVWTNRGPV